MTILYQVHNNLYVNLTNRCPCSCTFCLRQTRNEMEDSGNLWLEREPSTQEVKAEFLKFPMETYEEVVFCGFGEPVERIEDLLEIASYIKISYNKKVRINTNGLGNLIHQRNITPEFSGKIDTVSVSLNTPDAAKFYELTRNKFGISSFQAMLDFTSEVKKYVPTVVMTTVDTTLTKEEETKCQEICESIGVTYRIRPWED